MALMRNPKNLMKGYVPAKVDIGVRGVMPFDTKLLNREANLSSLNATFATNFAGPNVSPLATKFT